jgi:autophagy-related protein 2
MTEAHILQTFEAVIPSEYTGIVLKIMDGTVRLYAPTIPGAIILYAGDLDLATNISGKVSESIITMGIQYLCLLAIDDVGSSRTENIRSSDAKGVAYLKVFV